MTEESIPTPQKPKKFYSKLGKTSFIISLINIPLFLFILIFTMQTTIWDGIGPDGSWEGGSVIEYEPSFYSNLWFILIGASLISGAMTMLQKSGPKKLVILGTISSLIIFTLMSYLLLR
jgi:hypothetical protein